MNSFFLYLCLVFSFVTVSMSRASVDVSNDNRFVAGFTQSECELTGSRLSPVIAPPLPRAAAVSSSSRFAVVTPSTHLTVVTPARLPVALSIRLAVIPSTRLVVYMAVARSTRLTVVPSARFVLVNPSFIVLDALRLRNPCTAAPQPVDHHISVTGVTPPPTRAISRRPDSFSRSAHVHMSRSVSTHPMSSLAYLKPCKFKVAKFPWQPHIQIIESRTVTMRLHVVLDLTSAVSPDELSIAEVLDYIFSCHCFHGSSQIYSTSKVVPSTTLRVVLFQQSFRISLQRYLKLAFADLYPSEDVPLTTLCVVLLRQPLRTSLQCREIQTSSETVFNCSQNPSIGLFNVDFDFFAFLRTRALGIQVKLLYGFLLSLATSIIRHVLVIFVYHFTVENFSGCNRLSPWGV
ncbi:hypothetical protein F2Q70_00001814 [Brassica cretica]|uniref:Uncharacterized protein n=1 Tax=Brassica cretica TaxID=69181 RepID=A0A8S9IL82_BRACR|nr:hypothetical protein F2Q70_00001814 [Brassica cretica]